MGNSALYESMAAYLALGAKRQHTPGHKGVLPPPLQEAARWDLTELAETDELYDPAGPLLEAEGQFARFYGSGAALLCAGGSSLCIQAMLAAACPPGSRVIAGRNAHISFMNAAALLDLEPVWLWPAGFAGAALPGRVTPGQVEQALAECPDAAAVYLTSPDYYGVLTEIAAIARLCRRRGVPLLVDNAHGAHLRFFPGLHPMEQGADFCCDSLHKTLPALTGAALLQARESAWQGPLRQGMALFGSTSPSFLILLSAAQLAAGIAGLAEGYRALAGRVAAVRDAAGAAWAVEQGPSDPCRIALRFAPAYSREQFLSLLAGQGIREEYAGSAAAVLLPGVGDRLEEEARLAARMQKAPLPPRAALPPGGQPVMRLRQARFAPWESVPLEKAAGRVAARPVYHCPPGVPLVCPGELIDEQIKNFCQACGVWALPVVK